MGKFKCEKCGKTFNYNKNLMYHQNNNACKDQNYSCKYCGKHFTTKTSMYRHMRDICIAKKKEETQKNEIFERLVKLEEENKELMKLKEQHKKLKKEMEKLKMTKNTTNNAGRDVNINNGTVNNITLVAYGSEDLSKLDRSELLKIFKQGYNSTLKLTEVVHFNPKHPEFHNVYITNIKDKYAMMYDGANWTLTIKDDLITRIYDDKKTYIEENLEEFIKSLTPSQRRALDRWVETDEEDEKIKMVKERIKLLLYNSRNIPIDTQKNISEGKKVKMIESSEKTEPVKVAKNSDIKRVVKSKVSVTKGETKTVNG